jgi:UDP-4-amino-4,6-dideoxy-N-acetyl-beta-L-altrosamine N-acetyltransferase
MNGGRHMFEHQGVTIRPIEDSDLVDMLRLRADMRVWTNLGDISMISRRAQEQWFSGLQNDPKRRYFVLCSEKHSFIGLVRLDEIDWIDRSVRVGGDILPDFHHQGYGTKMFELIKKYCFNYLNMNRLWLFVLETNEVALRLYSKSGFVEEGRQRQAIFRDGRYYDYIMMSLLRHEIGQVRE